MRNAKLKEQINNVIEFHFGRELWHTFPASTYQEATGSFVADVERICRCFKRELKFRMYDVDTTGEFPPDTDAYIGRKIKEARLNKGWSLLKLAKATRLDTDYIDGVERGESILGMCALEDILIALKMSSAAVLPF